QQPCAAYYGNEARTVRCGPRRRGSTAWCRGGILRDPPGSLEGDGGAGALERLLGLVRGLGGDTLENRLRGAVDQVLGLLQAEAGQGAHLLDDLDLLVTHAVEDDVELRLLLLGLTGVATGGGASGHGDGGRSSGGDLEGLLELLHEVGE